MNNIIRLSKGSLSLVVIFGCALASACNRTTTTTKRSSSLRSDDTQKNPLAIGLKLDGETSPLLRVGIPKASTGAVVLCESKTQITICDNSTTILAATSTQSAPDRTVWSTQAAVAPEANGVYFAVQLSGKIVLGFHLIDLQKPAPSPTPQPNNSDKHPGDVTGLVAKELEVIDLINQYHKENGHGPCTLTAELNGFALDNSRLQEQQQYSGHFAGHGVAEIAFYGPTTANDTFVGWQHSAGHDAIMRDGYTKCGVSAGTNGNSWTVSFK